MLSKLILFVIFVAILHFIYEAIIAPSIRLHLRNRLFTIRDSLRSNKIIHGIKKEDEEAFNLVHDGVNNLLTRLPQLTIYNSIALRNEYIKNQKLRDEVDARVALVEHCGNQCIYNAYTQANLIVEHAMLANMGGWFFYLIPIFSVLLVLRKLSNLAGRLLVTPLVDTLRIIPESNMQAA